MSDRQAVLDRRVRWLDRWRRSMATVIGALLALVLSYEATAMMDEPWPQPHVAALAFVAGLTCWLVTEVALAWVTALWETELDRLVANRGLPSARILRSR